jgi:hypothetical protein
MLVASEADAAPLLLLLREAVVFLPAASTAAAGRIDAVRTPLSLLLLREVVVFQSYVGCQ